MANLPSEMIDEIFFRLPAESLMQFKSVCRSWYTRIRSPIFAKSYKQHHANTMNSKKVIFYPSRCSRQPIYSFSLSSYTQGGATIYDVPNKLGHYYYEIVGSCDGLLLLVGISQLYLWNPLTRECIQLPPDAANPHPFFASASFAFGFGCATSLDKGIYKNYKVVLFDRIGLGIHHRLSEVSLYTSGTNIWRKMTDIPYVMYSSSAILVNSKLHFLIEDVDFSRKILAFDIVDEEFRVMPESNYDGRCGESIAELSGNLCVVCSNGLNDWYVWVMKEYGVKESWTNMFRINRLNNFEVIRKTILPLSIFIDGKLLLRARYLSDIRTSGRHPNLWIVCDNSTTHLATIPEINRIPANYNSITYEETLISPNAMITKEQGHDNITKEDNSK